jgi:hypothetical protein
MHAECLRQHFAEHGDRTAALERELGAANQKLEQYEPVILGAKAWLAAQRAIASGVDADGYAAPGAFEGAASAAGALVRAIDGLLAAAITAGEQSA